MSIAHRRRRRPDDAGDGDARSRDETGFTGVRLFSIGALEHPQPTWLDHPDHVRAVGGVRDLGLRVLVACLPEHLSRLQRVLAQFPDQPVVLDHCGFVALDGGPPYPEAAALFALVEHTNLHLKVTSHLLEAAERTATPARSSTGSSASSARNGWSGAPTTRRPTTARTPTSSRSPAHACRNLLGARPRARVGRHRARSCGPSWPGDSTAVTEPAFDVFDVHHHVGRAFDALGGDARAPSVDLAEEFARIELRSGCGSWTTAESTRRS